MSITVYRVNDTINKFGDFGCGYYFTKSYEQAERWAKRTGRFGSKLSLDYLSTGCKAAILVALEPSVCIDIRECGNNARDLIIKLCKNGSIALEENGIDYALDFDDSIDVCIGKYRFTTGYRLLKYMIDERDFEEYSDMSDVEMT